MAEEQEDAATTETCDVCGYETTKLEAVVVVVCPTCELNWDDIMSGFTEDFYGDPAAPFIRPRLVAELCREQKGICGICRERIEPWEDMHVDHIVPKARGGSSERSNLQAAHATCNLRKGARVAGVPPPPVRQPLDTVTP